MQKPNIPLHSATTAGDEVINTIDVIRLLRPLSGVLFSRMALYMQLMEVEWAEQKVRFSKMLAYMLLGFSSLLCVMLFGGTLIMTLSWDSPYRVQSIVAVIIFYGAGAGIAWLRFKSLSAASDQAFATTREELSADIALIKSKL